jgi:hypothetical protein
MFMNAISSFLAIFSLALLLPEAVLGELPDPKSKDISSEHRDEAHADVPRDQKPFGLVRTHHVKDHHADKKSSPVVRHHPPASKDHAPAKVPETALEKSVAMEKPAGNYTPGTSLTTSARAPIRTTSTSLVPIKKDSKPHRGPGPSSIGGPANLSAKNGGIDGTAVKRHP